MSSFITANAVFTASPVPSSSEEERDGIWTDFSRHSTFDDQNEAETLGIPSLQPYPSVRGRILETVPMRQPGTTMKHKRKEEMIQKQLAHRKRSSSEPPPLERQENETDCTCSDASNRRLSVPSPFFNRLAKVKHMQKELREQQRPPLSANESHGSTPGVNETKNLSFENRSHSTGDIAHNSRTSKSKSSSTEPSSRDENRDIRINIVRRREASFSKLSGVSKEGRYSVYKEWPRNKGEEPLVAAKSITVAKLREHRRRKLGIVSQVVDKSATLMQNETEIDIHIDDNVPTSSHSSESLGSLVTASTALIESGADAIRCTNTSKNKLGKTFSQSSESLGSLETASWPLTATEIGVITYTSVPERNPGKKADLDNNLTHPECDSQSVDYIMTNPSSQISESLGSLESAATPLTGRGEITHSIATESDGYDGSLEHVAESGTTDSCSTSKGESSTPVNSSVDPNGGRYVENEEFVRVAVHSTVREPIEAVFFNHPTGGTSEGVVHVVHSSSDSEQPDLEGQTSCNTGDPTDCTDDASALAQLALSAEGSGKSFDFREIEGTGKIIIDPSWDANKVYFNEFDSGKKSVGDGFGFFESQNDDWVSMIFSSRVASQTAGRSTNDEIMPHFQEQVEEEKKERDSASLDGINDLVGSGSRWPIMNESTADSRVTAALNLSERDSEADDADLLHGSSSSNISSPGDSDAQPRKVERIREYNTLAVDEESSMEESGSEQSEQDDFIPGYVPQTDVAEEDISTACENEDFTPDNVPQTNPMEEDSSTASEQSDLFDFGASHFPRDSSQFVSDKYTATPPLTDGAEVAFDVSDGIDGTSQVPWDEGEPSAPTPLTDGAEVTFDVSDDIDGTSQVPWDEGGPSAPTPCIPLASVSLPPPPPPFPRVSRSKRSRNVSKGSLSIPLVAPPPLEKLKKWEEEKARPMEHLNKLHLARASLPPPPPPPPPKSFFHRGRQSHGLPKKGKSNATYKQAIQFNNDSALSAVVLSDTRMAEKVDIAISAASLKFEEHISSHGFTGSSVTNGQQPSSSPGLFFGVNNDQSHMSAAEDGNQEEDIDETYHCREPDQSEESRREWVHPDSERSPFGEAISKVPVLLSRILEFLGDPVAVCRVKMLNRGCKEYVEGNEHLLMRDAVRLGGISMQVRPAFWLWVTLEKMESPRDYLCDEGCVEELERQGRQGKWHSVIERDVARAFGNLPPHKSGARLRTDSIVRALVSWGRGRMIKRGVKGEGEAPPHLSTSNSYDSDITPTDTVSDWGAVAPASSTASELDESLRLNNNQVPSNHDEGRRELALSGSVLRDDLKVELRGKLRFVLHALAVSNPDVGYCQGMDYVVAHLLRILQETIRWKAALGTLPDIIHSAPSSIDVDDVTQEVAAGQYSKIDKSLVVEETLFHVMETFFGTYNLRHFYYPELRCLKTCCRVFERLIQLKLPVLADHFEHHELNVGLFALGWFQTLFLYLPSMPSATVCHMWDIWLVERSFKIFFRVGTAILFLSQPILLNHELEGMMSYLNTFPDATLLSPDILIACALQIKVTNKLLMELERDVVTMM